MLASSETGRNSPSSRKTVHLYAGPQQQRGGEETRAHRQNSSRRAMVMVRLPLFDVICPNVEEVIPVLGAPRFGWLRRLYNSARNCRRMRSRMGCQRLMT